jgi:hypothetical protein
MHKSKYLDWKNVKWEVMPVIISRSEDNPTEIRFCKSKIPTHSLQEIEPIYQ